MSCDSGCKREGARERVRERGYEGEITERTMKNEKEKGVCVCVTHHKSVLQNQPQGCSMKILIFSMKILDFLHEKSSGFSI